MGPPIDRCSGEDSKMQLTTNVAVDRAAAVLIGMSLVAVFVLPSQSAASFPTYLLALTVLLGGRVSLNSLSASPWLALSMAALLLYFAASVLWSDASSGRSVASTYSRCLLIATFVAGAATSLRFVPFMSWLCRAMTIGAGGAALAALIAWQLHPNWDGRLVGLGQLRSSVTAAMSFAAALMFALDVALNDTRLWRLGGIASVLALVAAILATGSRDGYLAATVGAGSLAALTCRIRLTTSLLGLFMLVAAIAATMSIPEWRAVAWPRGDSFRSAIWAAEWQNLNATNLWFGRGILTPDEVVIGTETFAHPHSLYLASALQGGLVGLVLLLAVLTYAGGILMRAVAQRSARLGVALLVTGATAYVFDGWELIDKVSVSWLAIWLPVAIAIAVSAGAVAGAATLRVCPNVERS